MNKFILSILMSLTLIGVVNAETTTEFGDISVSGGGKVKVKKSNNKNKDSE